MPFFQGATDFEINGGSFQDMRDQYNHNRNESFNIHGNNNKTDFAPNYSRTDNRIHDSRNMNMQEYMSPGRNHAVGPHPQNYAPAMSQEQLYQLQILELQRANLQLQLAASAAASQSPRLGNTNIPQLSERPYDTAGNIGGFLPANGGLDPGVAPSPSPQSPGHPQQQHLHSLPQLFLPQIPLPPSLPSFPPPPQFSPQPAPVPQQHPPSPGPEAFLGSPQQPSNSSHALPGLGAIGAIQQRFERLAQQAPAPSKPTQPSVPQSPPSVGTIPSPPPTGTIHPPPTQEMPQGSYHTSNLVQSSPVVSPAPAVGVPPTTIPHAPRPTTASSSISSSSSIDPSKGPVSATLNPPNPATATMAAQAPPIANVAVSHQAIPIIAPQPLTAQAVNTGPSPSVTQIIGAVPLSTPQSVNAATTITNPPPPPTAPADFQTPQNIIAPPSMHANFTLSPVPVPTTSPTGAPSTGAISSVTVRPLLSFPTPSTQASLSPGSGASATTSVTPEKKKRQSWIGRKFNNFKKKSKD